MGAATAEQGYGLDLVEIDVLPLTGTRRKTLSRPKEDKSERVKRFEKVAGRRVCYLDITYLEAALLVCFILLNMLWVTWFAKDEWIFADQVLPIASACFDLLLSAPEGWVFLDALSALMTFHCISLLLGASECFWWLLIAPDCFW